jgi:hypothetical protein
MSTTENVTFAVKLDDKASGGFKGLIGQMDRAAQKGGLMGSVFQGVGQQLGRIGFNLVADAIGSVTSAIGDSIGKAREEEAGIARLNAALDANVKGYTGNRDAIEEVIASREKLAFSDGEQRASLGLLVARTHDVNKALDLEREAMDLARFKGIDLATASEIIGKVYGGNTAILTRYGIQVTKGATATEALAQIQKAAAGQAEAFGNTTEGASQSMKIAFEDLQEDLGKLLMPMLKDFAIFVRDQVIPGIRNLAGIIGPILGKAFDVLGSIVWKVGDALRKFSEYVTGVLKPLQDLAGGLGDATNKLDAFFHGMDQASYNAATDIVERFKTVASTLGISTEELAARQKQIMEQYHLSARDAFLKIEGDMQHLGVAFHDVGTDIDTALGPTWTNVVERAHDTGINAAAFFAEGVMQGIPNVQGAMSSLKGYVLKPLGLAAYAAKKFGWNIPHATAQGIRSNHGEVVQAMLSLKYQLTHPIDYAAEKAFLAGQLMDKNLQKGLQSEDPNIRKQAERTSQIIIDAQRDLIQKSYDDGNYVGEGFLHGIAPGLAQAAALAAYTAWEIRHALEGAGGTWTPTGGTRGGYVPRAGGGPVAAGGMYTVGEGGREEKLLMYPGGGGMVIPTGRGSGGSSGDTNVTVNVNVGFMSGSITEARRIANAIVPELTRVMRSQRLLPSGNF